MKRIIYTIMACMLFLSMAMVGSAAESDIENVHFSIDGTVTASFSASQLVKNGQLLIYKNDDTGYIATIEIDPEGVGNDMGYYNATVRFEDGKAYTGFSFDFDTVSNTISAAYSPYGRFPFRHLDIDFEKSPRVENYEQSSCAMFEIVTTTDNSYVGASCNVTLDKNGIFQFKRSNILDSHAKGGYDGFTAKMLFYKVLNYLPIIIAVAVVVVIIRKNKKA